MGEAYTDALRSKLETEVRREKNTGFRATPSDGVNFIAYMKLMGVE
jgi:hypothetical protein